MSRSSAWSFSALGYNSLKDHPAAGIVLHTADLYIPGMGGMVAVKRLGDGGGDEEHPVQVIPALTQGLAGDEIFSDRLTVLVPFEVDIQIYALTAAVVGGAEDVGVLGNLPAIFPIEIHEEIFIRQIALTFQPVL